MNPKRQMIHNVGAVEAVNGADSRRKMQKVEGAGIANRTKSRGRIRKESQARTRTRLIEVARSHFLRYGLAGATAAKIVAEAGFTRGALYANFAGLEDLFVAVMRASADEDLLLFRSIAASGLPAEERFAAMRETIGSLVTDSPWILLQAEFQANALRSETMRAAYVEQRTIRLADGAEILCGLREELGLEWDGSAEEVVEAMGSLIEGLAIRQGIVRDAPWRGRREVTLACFDRLVRRRI